MNNKTALKVYHYCPETGRYLSTSEAQESPLEDGVFLIPSSATDKKPPKQKKGHSLHFDGGEWVNVPDATNCVIINAARAKRDELLSATDWTQLRDVPADTSAMFSEYRQALRDVTKQSGFPVNIDWPVRPV